MQNIVHDSMESKKQEWATGLALRLILAKKEEVCKKLPTSYSKI